MTVFMSVSCPFLSVLRPFFLFENCLKTLRNAKRRLETVMKRPKPFMECSRKRSGTVNGQSRRTPRNVRARTELRFGTDSGSFLIIMASILINNRLEKNHF